MGMGVDREERDAHGLAPSPVAGMVLTGEGQVNSCYGVLLSALEHLFMTAHTEVADLRLIERLDLPLSFLQAFQKQGNFTFKLI
jgi:hypothetical protein